MIESEIKETGGRQGTRQKDEEIYIHEELRKKCRLSMRVMDERGAQEEYSRGVGGGGNIRHNGGGRMKTKEKEGNKTK